jgi:hypothetical protein
MILVAWKEHDGVLITNCELTASSDFASIIDEDGLYQGRGFARKN